MEVGLESGLEEALFGSVLDEPATLRQLVRGFEVLGFSSSRRVGEFIDRAFPMWVDVCNEYFHSAKAQTVTREQVVDYQAALRVIRWLQEARIEWHLQEQADIRDHQEVV